MQQSHLSGSLLQVDSLERRGKRPISYYVFTGIDALEPARAGCPPLKGHGDAE